MSERPRWLTETARSGTDTDADLGREPGVDAAPPRRPVAGGRRQGRRPRRASGAGARGAGNGRTPVARSSGAAGVRGAGGSGWRSGAAAISPSSRALFARRAAQVRRRPWRLGGVLAGFLVLVAAVAWAVGFSPLLATRTVTVTGLSDPAEQQGVAAAARIAVGTPLARVDIAGATDRVGRIPAVASVTVSRSWPSTVVVSVQRKVPVLAVKNPQGQLQVVDVTGIPYETVDAVPAGVAQVNAAADTADPEGIRAAISILQLLPAAQRAQVTQVTVTSADLVTLQLGAVSVVWGGLADGPKKLTVLQALLPTNPGVIDVSAPDTPVSR